MAGFDTLNFGLRNEDVRGVNFLYDVPQYLSHAEPISFENGTIIKGTIGDVANKSYFDVTVSGMSINLRNGSLCKYRFGNNLQTLTRQETQRAIEQLSDTLHLPLHLAKMYRIDVAQNLILQHPIEVYLNHLGQMEIGRKKITRWFDERGSLYYYYNGGMYVLYDKLKELSGKGQLIPELYKGKNVLRLEHRYTARLPKAFNAPCVTAAMLYDEDFYIDVVNRWHDSYKAIKKVNETILNFNGMKGKKGIHQFAIKAAIKFAGGELELIEKIKEAQKLGEIDSKTAYYFRQEIEAAIQTNAAITAQNELILELDKKVNEARKHYR